MEKCCPNCGEVSEPKHGFCPECGSEIEIKNRNIESDDWDDEDEWSQTDWDQLYR